MNKYQEALNELKDLVHSELDGTKMINKHLAYCNIFQDLIDQNKTLTLDECIQEWEEKGWKVDKDSYAIELWKYNIYHLKETIIIFTSDRHLTADFDITYELSNLLIKTLKALEVENG